MRPIIVALLLVATTIVVLPTNASAETGISFSAHEAGIILDWYGEHGSGGYGGQKGKKAKGLPPGIARNLARGKPLPPGIAKRYLPDDLIRRLPPPPHGFERVIVDGKIMLVEIATRVIHDILTDIVLR